MVVAEARERAVAVDENPDRRHQEVAFLIGWSDLHG
jgi:hypothetical protein